MTTPRRLTLIALAAPLSLALAACGSDDAVTGEGGLESEPVAEVQAPAGQSWSDVATRTDEGGWVVGNPDAAIGLVEYGSLTCPACAAFSTEGSQALHNDYIESGRVSYELRSVVRSLPDLLLTRMLECGATEAAVPLADQVWADLNEVMAAFQSNAAALDQAMAMPEEQRFYALAEAGGIVDYFAARGISRDQARACLTDTAAIEQLAEKTQKSAADQNVTATPTFFLNGERIEPTRWSEVEPVLQRAGAR